MNFYLCRVISIHFFEKRVKSILKKKKFEKDWLLFSLKKAGVKSAEINFVFCSDSFLLGVNKKHLDHDYYTDIITFEYSFGGSIIGDVYISVDRVKENAKTYNVPVEEEAGRVMAHGILHLLGYRDKSPRQKREMKEMEDKWLATRKRLKNKATGIKNPKKP